MDGDGSAAPPMCPSAGCEPGALLLGLVMPDGEVAFLAERTEIDADFVRLARAGRAPERRFRFSSPCRKGACAQWRSGRCGVIDALLQDEERAGGAGTDLPACAIRDQCRWYEQTGAAACRLCPQVITDLRAETEAASDPAAG